jgi:cytochrome c oxidase subunit 4
MSEPVHAHPSDKAYIGIAAVLGVVTAIEVALSYVKWGNANAPLLLIGMAVKFFLVVSFFMHLRFDSKLFRRLLVSGLLFAIICYIGVLLMFPHLPGQGDPQEVRYTPSGITQS